MWMTRRVGRNTAISFPMWSLALVGLWLVGTASNADVNVHRIGLWLLAGAVLWTGHTLWALRAHQAKHTELDPSCRHCVSRANELRALEAREAATAEMTRLSRKYRA